MRDRKPGTSMIEAALTTLRTWWRGKERPQHLRSGELGEGAAKKHLKRQGLKFLTANAMKTLGTSNPPH